MPCEDAEGQWRRLETRVLAPVIAPPSDVTAEATSAAGAVVAFAAPRVSDDSDPSPAVSVSHASGSLFPIDGTTVTITAVDDSGKSASATFVVTVRDTTAPVVTVPGPMIAEAVGPAGGAVTFSATATDAVSDVTPACTPASGTTFPMGTTTVTCRATDAAGNTGVDISFVTVRDTTAPSITALTLPNGGVIWPPNGTMIPLTVFAAATDAVSVPVCGITNVVNSEETAGRGRRAGPDWTITGPLSVELPAERDGNGPGRVYTLTVTCSDEAGNLTSGTMPATVPHDRRN